MTRDALKAHLAGWEAETVGLAQLPIPPDEAVWRTLIEEDLGVPPLSPGIYDVLALKLALRKPSRKREPTGVKEVDLDGVRFVQVDCACGATNWVQVRKALACPACGKRLKVGTRDVLRWDPSSGTFRQETTA